MKGLILCGGQGTRLRPFSHTRPKHLLPVGNRPLIQYAIDKMHEAGIQEIGIVVPPRFRDEFEDTLGVHDNGARLSYIVQDRALGLADAVRSGRAFINNEPFLLFLGDNFITADLTSLIQQFCDHPAQAMLLISKVTNPSRFGVVQLEQSRVVKVVEKPSPPPSPYAIVGVYLFRPEIFEAIEQTVPSPRGEYEITDAIQRLIDTGHDVVAEVSAEWWRDAGKPEDILACNHYVLTQLHEQRIAKTANIHASSVTGSVVIEAGAKVVDSMIRGPVVIGAGTHIVGSRIGPFVSIRDHVNVVNSNIENSIVMDQTQIRHITGRMDQSIVGTQVVMEGAPQAFPRIQINVSDHSVIHLL